MQQLSLQAYRQLQDLMYAQLLGQQLGVLHKYDTLQRQATDLRQDYRFVYDLLTEQDLIERPYAPEVPSRKNPNPRRFNYHKDDEEKEYKYKKRSKEYFLNRLQDPYYRITGEAKYSDIMNKMLKERYGNVYT